MIEMSTKDTDKDKIFDLISNYEFNDVKYLIEKIEEKHNIPKKKSIKIIIDLEDEKKIKFITKKYNSFIKYLLSNIVNRFWGIQLFCASVFLLNIYRNPEILPLKYFQNLMGVIFLLFFPGFSFVDFFIKDGNNNGLEKILFSVGISLLIVPVLGILLNNTPFGLNPLVLIIILWFQIFFMSIIKVYNDFKNQVP
jgi:hypothetical protein